jgi:hypothetical protein
MSPLRSEPTIGGVVAFGPVGRTDRWISDLGISGEESRPPRTGSPMLVIAPLGLRLSDSGRSRRSGGRAIDRSPG